LYLLLTVLNTGCETVEIKSNPIEEDGLWFSHQAGFYNGPFKLEVTPADTSMKIYYTVDGSNPTVKSTLYSDPIDIQNLIESPSYLSEIPTTPLEGRGHLDEFIWKAPSNSFFSELFRGAVLRFKSFKNGKAVGDIVTNSYFVSDEMDKKYSFGVVSITTDTANLYNYYDGIYTTGINFDTVTWKNENDPWWPPGNFQQKGKKWERPAHVELFDSDGTKCFSVDAGIRINGAIIGGFPLKSLRIVMRKKFGQSYLNYRVFPDEDVSSFKRLVLRNSGNDFLSTMFRDALLQDIIKPLNLDLQATRPAVVFINGEYWGIQNIREKLDKHYIKAHFGLEEDEFDMVGVCGRPLEGSNLEYKSMMTFIGNNDLSISENYAQIADQIDLDNYIDYQLAELYYGNKDWPGNNIKVWKPKENGGKWRWLIFDLDISFGYDKIFNTSLADFNSIESGTAVNSKDWHNYDCSTLLLRSLLKNASFRKQFVCRYNELADGIFKSDKIISKINEFEARYEVEIEEHINRWHYPESVSYWKSEINNMRTYAKDRPAHFKNHLEKYLEAPLDSFCQ